MMKQPEEENNSAFLFYLQKFKEDNSWRKRNTPADSTSTLVWRKTILKVTVKVKFRSDVHGAKSFWLLFTFFLVSRTRFEFI
jgi:hypothetical protein